MAARVESAQVEVQLPVGEAVGDAVGPVDRQCGLADASGAGDRGQARAVGEHVVQRSERVGAAGEPADRAREGRRDGERPAWRRLRFARAVQPGVLAEDREVQLPQRGPGVDAVGGGEAFADLGVDLQGLGCAARPVQGEHQLLGESLAQRVRLQECAEFDDEVVALARFEFEGDALLDDREAELVQAFRERLDRAAGQARERGAVPFGEGPAVRLDRRGVASGPRQEAGFVDDGLAAQEVHFVDGGFEAVAAADPGQPRAVGSEAAAQAADHVLDLLFGRVGKGPLPERPGQAVDRHDPVRLLDQHREGLRVVAAADRDGGSRAVDAQGPEDAELHEASFGSRTGVPESPTTGEGGGALNRR